MKLGVTGTVQVTAAVFSFAMWPWLCLEFWLVSILLCKELIELALLRVFFVFACGFSFDLECWFCLVRGSLGVEYTLDSSDFIPDLVLVLALMVCGESTELFLRWALPLCAASLPTPSNELFICLSTLDLVLCRLGKGEALQKRFPIVLTWSNTLCYDQIHLRNPYNNYGIYCIWRGY